MEQWTAPYLPTVCDLPKAVEDAQVHEARLHVRTCPARELSNARMEHTVENTSEYESGESGRIPALPYCEAGKKNKETSNEENTGHWRERFSRVSSL